MDWMAHHKRICKQLNKFTSSGAFQSLAAHEKMDSILLNHLLAQFSSAPPIVDENSQSIETPLAVFASLISMPPGAVQRAPPVCGFKPTLKPEFVQSLYSRFGNNNFAIHSHLSTIGHGIFPFASRLFNHSCVPNAAAKYIFSAGNPVTMEVVALRDISPGEEVRSSTWHNYRVLRIWLDYYTLP